MDFEPEALLAQHGLGDASCVPIPGGLQHDLFRIARPDGGHEVFKVGRTDRPFGDAWDPHRDHWDGLRAEAQALGYIGDRLPVPTPYRLLPSEHPCALMRFLPGSSVWTMWERGRVNDDALRKVCFTMGGALAHVHRIHRPEDPGAIPDLPGASVEDARLLHLDYHLGNVMVRRSGLTGWEVLGLVDWVLCRWGPREADLVELSISLFRQVEGTRGAFLGGYRHAGGAPLSREFEDLWVQQELLRRLEEGVDDPQLRARWEMWEGDIRMGRQTVM